MPDKILNDSFYLKHYDVDLNGSGGFAIQPPLLPPGVPQWPPNPPFPKLDPLNYGAANMYYGSESGEYFTFDPEDDESDLVQITPVQGQSRWNFVDEIMEAWDGDPETGSWEPVVPHIGDVRWDEVEEELVYWDGVAWIPLDLTTHTGGTFIVFLTRPQQVAPGLESEEVTIQRQDGDGTPLTVGDLEVYLYSTDPDMTFFPSDVVTILDGDDGYNFTYLTPNEGTPVITASPVELL